MIKTVKGWHIRLLREQGVIASALYQTLTRNAFPSHRFPVDRRFLYGVSPTRPYTFWTATDHARSVIARETTAWCQIGMAISLTCLKGTHWAALAEAEGRWLRMPFPNSAIQMGNLFIAWAYKYQNQTWPQLQRQILQQREAMAKEGMTSRWILPATQMEPLPPDLGFKMADHTTLPFVLDPRVRDPIIGLDIDDITLQNRKARP
ncbi:hypothetical protein SCOR_02345 [Sulfidibacter corallicola]|uniref:Uncharacterized protein n=1 Tax=Sulfidibacter corallicola TaxID=2818388 RepID=A0A8A4TFA8_SULCO|nr:hypothetical protein [Sulfidibacter corallicola]QTD48636.1 hypothetical protein J3U87_23900 [Sulfidibacter corallicola]